MCCLPIFSVRCLWVFFVAQTVRLRFFVVCIAEGADYAEGVLGMLNGFDRIINNVVHVYASIRVYTCEKRLGISNTPSAKIRDSDKSAVQNHASLPLKLQFLSVDGQFLYVERQKLYINEI